MSAIEWTESTWNPVTGCTKLSKGCLNCYAERMAKRLHAMGHPNYRNCFKVTCHHNMLQKPLFWKKSQMVFVNSMSDLFHEQVPLEFIQNVFETMHQARWHCFQLLTKRAGRLLELSSVLKWTPNIWMGVTVEDVEYLDRIEQLVNSHAKIKFLSLEPLLSPISNLPLEGIDWVIVGGESGPGARPMKKEWVLEIRDQCIGASVPFFFKQWGGINKKKNGRILGNKTWDEMPATLLTK